MFNASIWIYRYRYTHSPCSISGTAIASNRWLPELYNWHSPGADRISIRGFRVPALFTACVTFGTSLTYSELWSIIKAALEGLLNHASGTFSILLRNTRATLKGSWIHSTNRVRSEPGSRVGGKSGWLQSPWSFITFFCFLLKVKQPCPH